MPPSTDEQVMPDLPELEIKAAGPTPAEQWVNSEKVQASAGYPPLVFMLADAFQNWVERIALDCTSQAVTVRYQIDGVWREMTPLDRQTGDYMIAVLKQIAGLNYRVRDRAQKGHFKAEMYRRKFTCNVRCEPVPSGERIAIQIDLPRAKPESLVEMGMREKSFEQFRGFFGQKCGVIVASTLPGDGESTLWSGVKAAGDRFMSDYVTLEPEGKVEPEVVNVNSITYTNEKPFSETLNGLMLREPDAVFLPNVTDPDMARVALDMTRKYQRLLILQVQAHSAADAIYRLLALGLEPGELKEVLIGSIAMRTARRLCDNCKQAYEPDPATLSRLGIPVGRVRQFYAPFDPQQFAEVDRNGNTILPPPCEHCQGVGYFARLGLFELIEMNDETRQLISRGRPLAEMQEYLRRNKVRTFREEGIAAIALGQTSIEEIQRVLKK